MFICDKQIGDLESFLTYLNSNMSNVTFTGQMESIEVCFLDVLLVVSQDYVITCLYRKPLAGNSLLMAQSNHPKHTIKGIPVGKLICLQWICSEDIDFDREDGALYKRFRQQGYPIWNVYIILPRIKIERSFFLTINNLHLNIIINHL